jgi:hypothetical protein
MAVKVGERYYFIAHAYFHYLGTVSEVLGVRRVALRDAIQVHSHSGNWTEFFRRGITTGTKYDVIGDIPDVGYIAAIAWKHELPE